MGSWRFSSLSLLYWREDDSPMLQLFKNKSCLTKVRRLWGYTPHKLAPVHTDIPTYCINWEQKKYIHDAHGTAFVIVVFFLSLSFFKQGISSHLPMSFKSMAIFGQDVKTRMCWIRIRHTFTVSFFSSFSFFMKISYFKSTRTSISFPSYTEVMRIHTGSGYAVVYTWPPQITPPKVIYIDITEDRVVPNESSAVSRTDVPTEKMFLRMRWQRAS